MRLFLAYARAARDPDVMDVDGGPLLVNGRTQLPKPDKQEGAYKALVFANNYSPAGYLTQVGGKWSANRA